MKNEIKSNEDVQRLIKLNRSIGKVLRTVGHLEEEKTILLMKLAELRRIQDANAKELGDKYKIEKVVLCQLEE